MTLLPSVQELVDTALNNAVDNGFEEFLFERSPALIALDLCLFDSDIEVLVFEQDEEPDMLIPYVQDWQRRQS